MARKRNVDRPWRIDSAEDFALVSIIAILLGIMVAGLDDYAVDFYTAYQMSKFAPPSGDTLIFPKKYMDRFAEDFSTAYPRYEVAYCVTVNGDRVVKVEVANIRVASEKDAIFSCPSYVDGFVHLHPNGNWRPSDTDIWTLKQLREKDNKDMFMCIYYGRGLSCWTLDKDKEVKNINVKVG